MRQLTRTAAKGSNGARLTLAGLALCAAAPAGAQAPAAPTFSEVIEVRLINLEVVVTSGGERVAGLGPGDLRLEVDGDEVPIELFAEIRDGRAAVLEEGSTAAQPVEPGEPVGTSYLVFIDDFFAVPTHRNQVLRGLRDDLPILEPGDRMAIVAFDGRGLELLSGWSGSRQELSAALDRAMDRSAYGLRRLSELRRLDFSAAPSRRRRGAGFAARSNFSTIGFIGSGRETAAVELQPVQEITSQVARAVRAAAAALRGFATAPGRRVMLVLSGGWPAFSSEWGYPPPDGSADLRATSPRERYEVFDPLVDGANRLGYTLYPVDLQPYAGISAHGAEIGAAGEAELAMAQRDLLEQDSRDALEYLAGATGGRAFEGSAGLTALERAAEDVRSYYWIGFMPIWQGDDAAHRVEVKPRRKGYRTRSRSGFIDSSRRSEVSLLIEGAQLFDRPLPGDGEVAARLGTPQRAGRGRIRVPLVVEVPLDKITMWPEGDGFAAALELRVAARDEDGETAAISVVDLAIRRPQAPAAGEVEVREVELELRSRPHRLIVALYEPASGLLLSERLELAP